jgi:hypothetical protein
MKDAGFPCFKPDSFKKLQQRFFLDKEHTELRPLIDALIVNAMKSFITTGYDIFQQKQNGIFYV